ncbi:MAG: PQQ-like beta-propeller repeat protein [Acidobacteria bacterium]|nr:PQQ-like beta-propeller repeat protein [Acidobacteriota bacterium]MBI3656941.1 PQQ-like beta-propeller repeat protein [Acidobacteriota bacterium]
MKTCLQVIRSLVWLLTLSAGSLLFAQWPQWAHDPQHTSFLSDVTGQPVSAIRWSLDIDNTVPPEPRIIEIHYASPLIDATNTIYMTKKERTPDLVIHRKVMKITSTGSILCNYESDYVPPPSAWEPVFHPVLVNGNLYVPGARGVLHVVDTADCTRIDTLSPYEMPEDPTIRQQLLTTVFVAGAPMLDDAGNIFYTMLVRAGAPLGLENQLVKISGEDGTISTVTVEELMGEPAFLPALNAAVAVAPDGTIYMGVRKPGIIPNGWLVAINADLTFKWKGSMSSDPARVAIINDLSSSCPVVGPDGRVFYGGVNTNEQSAGYLYAFSPSGEFLGSFDFGWDITPAIYPDPDGDPTHYHLVQKYNRYLSRRYYMVSIDPNTMERECQWELVGREWCINAPAIDKDGAVYTNGEDGYLYRLTGMYPAADGSCNPQMTRISLDRARDAAYTPLALGPDGTVYTLNNGRMFAVGNPANE